MKNLFLIVTSLLILTGCNSTPPKPIKTEKIKVSEVHYNKPSSSYTITRTVNKDGFIQNVTIYDDNGLNYKLEFFFDNQGKLYEKEEYLALSEMTIRTYQDRLGNSWYKSSKKGSGEWKDLWIPDDYEPDLMRYWDYAEHYIEQKGQNNDTKNFTYTKEYSKLVNGHWTVCTIKEDKNREITKMEREILEVWN